MSTKAAGPSEDLLAEVMRFLDTTCAHGAENHHDIEPMDCLYWAYRRYSSRRRRKPMGVSTFGRCLSACGFQAAKIGEGKSRRRAWKGIWLDRELKKEAEASLALKVERSPSVQKSGLTRKSSGKINQVAPVGLVGRYLAQCIRREPDAIETFADIYASFLYFCDVCDYRSISAKKFSQVLTRRFRIESVLMGHASAKARCISAWNKDPVGGVIGVQTGPH